jgi:hypothetical protein
MMHRRSHAVRSLALAVLVTLALAAPALAAAPEAPVTQPATGVSSTEAILHGLLNPGGQGEPGEYDFLYRQSPSECTEGSVAPEPPGAALGEEEEAVSATVTGLQPSSQYTFCARATHEGESSTGEPLSFTTAASKPTVASESASAITPFAATLEAQVNPENQVTTACHFEYGALTVSEKTAPCSPETLEGFGEQLTSAPISELTPATPYHYRVVVENATGTTEGPEQEFTTLTLEKPILGAESTSAVTSTGATLQAQVNPNYQETTYAFEYATNEALTGAITVNGEAPLPAEFAELPASKSTEALQPRTVYYYRVLATNGTGTSEGPVEHFTTVTAPVVTTSAAQGVTRTSAALSGTVNPAGEPTTYHFAYATAANYQPGEPNPYVKGATTPASQPLAADVAVHAAGPATASELQPGTTYHYALVATNPLGTVIGPDVEFTTARPTPPLASTGEATGVSQISATLNGSVDTRELPTIAQFEFGTTPGAGSLVPATVTGAGSSETLTASFDSDLQPATTYYYRTVATNVDGTGYGEERTFTTGAFPGQPGSQAVSLVGWPAFVLKELVAGIPAQPGVSSGPKPLSKKQKLARALKACAKKPKSKRAACRRQVRRRFR